ncbi:MAG: flagellar basal body P-ring formation chaperone FlgA [Bacteriovoracaceae bacterium]
MKIKTTTLFLTFFIGITAYAETCEITLKKFLIRQKNSNLNSLFSSKCSKKTKEDVSNFLMTSSGEFQVRQFKKYLKLTDQEKIICSDTKFNVLGLDEFLNSKSKLKKLRFKDSKFLGGPGFLASDHISGINTECADCFSPGEKTIKLHHSFTNNSWIKTKLLHSVVGLFPKKTLSPSHELKLSAKDFQEKEVLTLNPKEFIQSTKNIKFLKLRGTIHPNSPLRKIQVLSENLVSAGRPTKVLLNSRGLKLSLKAIPLSYGQLGDIIKLRNEKSAKIIVGKVIDHNTVVVDF